MKKSLLLGLFAILLTATANAQDCFDRLEKAFTERGSTAIANGEHSNVYLSFFEDGTYYCYSGRVRVDNGTVVKVFVEYVDGEYETVRGEIKNLEGNPPNIINGISEMIETADGEKFKVVFIDNLKPKKKKYQQVTLPDDL